MSAPAPPPPPSPPPPPPPITRLEPDRVRAETFTALRAGAVLARAEAGVVSLVGPGAVTCLQGLLTSDVEKPGDGAFVYGALLTPKGMIVVDGWAARRGATVRYTVPAEGRERALAIFTRSIPPRLARIADQTADVAVFRLAGPRSLAAAEAAGLPLPPGPGRVIEADARGGGITVARASETAPFVLQVDVPRTRADAVRAKLAAAGAAETDPTGLELARILAGWPGLASEVDEKTIPQEVRYDEIGGVSYTKGCYTGQETVSRLHFRGHTNRYLRGLVFDAEPGAPPAGAWSAVSHLDREGGRVTSLAWVPGLGVAGGGLWIGLAIVRSEERRVGKECRSRWSPYH